MNVCCRNDGLLSIYFLGGDIFEVDILYGCIKNGTFAQPFWRLFCMLVMLGWCLKCSKCTSSTQQWSTAILHWRSVQHNQTSTQLNGNLYWSQLDQTRTIQPKRQEGGNNSGPNKEPPWVAHWPAGSFVLGSWVGRSILLCLSDLNRRWFHD